MMNTRSETLATVSHSTARNKLTRNDAPHHNTTHNHATRTNLRRYALELAASECPSLAWTGAGLALPLFDLWPRLVQLVAHRHRSAAAAVARQYPSR